MRVRTRFAPSPTGFLHIGGARTALFCHLHARRVGGVTLLRIEDTDRQRSTQAAVDAILEGLAWLGLQPDEGPIFQSHCTDVHLKRAHQLLQAGKAYRCYCTPEELDLMRAKQREQNIKPRYDGRCRERSGPGADRPFVIRFKTPGDGTVAWEDRIQGRIAVNNSELDDLILVRSDGTPTYNLAVVTDDHEMGINLIIRGEDHLSNTPRQIHLFQALGWSLPTFAHMPLLHGSDGAKLSKRHGAVSVLQYREQGFLPQAINNYLVRLGWSHGEQEIFTMTEMETVFDIAQVGRSAAIFNLEKLLWINGHHIRKTNPETLAPLLAHQLATLGITDPDPALLTAVIPELRERSKNLVEMAQKALFFFLENITTYDAKAVRKHIRPAILAPLEALHGALANLPEWTLAAVEAAFQKTLADHRLKMGQLAQPVRLALTGSAASPGIFETLFILGREKSLRRLAAGVELFKKEAAPEQPG